MIKINLLPFRAARKKENIKKQISLYVLTVVLLLTVMGYFYLSLSGTVKSLREEKVQKEKELATYRETNQKLAAVQKMIQEIRTKLDVIRELERNKSGPVHLLDEIAMAVPKDKLWLTSLEEKRGNLTLKGSAMDNETVALFMTNLEGSEYVVAVDLQSTKLNNLEKYKINVVDFILECKTYSYKETTPTTQPAK